MQIVIDDLRTLPVQADHLRTSQAGLDWLRTYDKVPLDCIWLDHDLGGEDTIMPVVDYLCELAYNGTPFPVSVIKVHSMNPVGSENVVRSLVRYGYNVRRVPVPE